MGPEISIIVPVYNVEKYIKRCIDSILAQSFSDFELILVDDGSPDNCPAICDEYATMDSRIRVVHKVNGGVSSARNTGLAMACGKYILFCDSDDYVDSSWCQELYNAVSDNPASCVVSNFMRVHQDRAVAKIPPEQLPEGVISYYEMFLMELSGATWNKIYDNEVLAKNNIRFDSNLRIGEDIDFNVRYHQCCNRIIYINKPLYYYCDTPESALNSYHSDWLGLHLFPFYVRIPLIERDHKLTEYCDGWLYTFINFFGVVFDKRNKESLFAKLRYNQRMLNTKEFQFCLRHASGKNESPMVMKLLKTKCYYLYWLFTQLVKIKNNF